ncbi:MAG: hypothetical protein CL912_12090 [Deltaproteobacteria bacterium]|nr:hypothetical protein [Deltaproteobacteria bacterium]|tara:strand:- start:3532 stop:3723 length:192 start_codon:yes stop_codon:yes gene_type:complete
MMGPKMCVRSKDELDRDTMDEAGRKSFSLVLFREFTLDLGFVMLALDNAGPAVALGVYHRVTY